MQMFTWFWRRWLFFLYFCMLFVGCHEFGCQYECNWLPVDAHLQYDLLCTMSLTLAHLCYSCYTVHFVVMRSWSDNGTCVSMLTKCARRMFSGVFCSVLQWSFSLCSIDPMFVIVVVCKFGLGTNVAHSQLAIFSVSKAVLGSVSEAIIIGVLNTVYNVVTINVCNLTTYEILTIITYSIC